MARHPGNLSHQDPSPQGVDPGAAEAAAGLPAAEERRPRVLIVDDNRDAADSLAMLFGLLSCETRVAYDGMHGAREAADFHPDMAVLDISMPLMDGYQLAALLRREMPDDAPVLVALTALNTDRDKAEAKRAGFDYHLSKPVDSASLCHLVMRAIGQRH